VVLPGQVYGFTDLVGRQDARKEDGGKSLELGQQVQGSGLQFGAGLAVEEVRG